MLPPPRQRHPTRLSLRKASVAALCAVALASCKLPHAKTTAAVTPSTKPAAVSAPKKASVRTIEQTPTSSEQRLGVVRVVGAHGSFVLIETPSAAATAAVPTGHLIHCRPPGMVTGNGSADLRISPERRQPFVVADVLSGSPSVGDVAYLAKETEPPILIFRPGTNVAPTNPASAPPPPQDTIPNP